MDVRGLKKYYVARKGVMKRDKAVIKSVDDVSFQVKRGETFSIVGESGCGKTTTAMCILHLVKPTAGEILFQNKPVISKKDLREFRKNVQVIFQDPYSSLNPKHTIRQIISEPLRNYQVATGEQLERRITSLLEVVGLSKRHLDRYPHEFSGGQRQRIGIARALALQPQLIVCDEPVSALDVSIQSQILNLMQQLQKEFHLTYVFISHDLSVVEHISDRVAVMYLGRIVEMGSRDHVFRNPQHPYTKALFSSVPIPDPEEKKRKERIRLQGDVPSPINPPSGCYFHTRCPYKMDACTSSYPKLEETAKGHYVACHLAEQMDGGGRQFCEKE